MVLTFRTIRQGLGGGGEGGSPLDWSAGKGVIKALGKEAVDVGVYVPAPRDSKSGVPLEIVG